MQMKQNFRIVPLTLDLAPQWAELVKAMPELYNWRFEQEGMSLNQVLNDPINHLKVILDHDKSRGKWGLPQVSYLGMIGNSAAGQISLRLELNGYLRQIAGHIGYRVHPSYRNKGVATHMLRGVCELLPEFGLKRVLITADFDNLASQKVMRNCGAHFVSDYENTEAGVHKKRCWIAAIQQNKKLWDGDLESAVSATLKSLNDSSDLNESNKDPYWPKWDNAWWHLCFLRELGLLHLVSEHALDAFEHHIDGHYQNHFAKSEADVPKGCSITYDFYCHCSLATAMSILLDAGRDPLSKRPWVRNWIANEYLETGGYNCDDAVYAKPNGSPSFVSSTVMLELLNQMAAFGDTLNTHDARNGVCRWLSERDFYLRKSTGLCADLSYLNLVFPKAYFYNPVRGYLAFLESEAQSKGLALPREYKLVSEKKATLPELNEAFNANLLQEKTLFERQAVGIKELRSDSLSSGLLLASMRPEVGEFMLGIEKKRIEILEAELYSCL